MIAYPILFCKKKKKRHFYSLVLLDIELLCGFCLVFSKTKQALWLFSNPSWNELNLDLKSLKTKDLQFHIQ